MIVLDRKGWWRAIFFGRGTTWSKIWRRVVLTTLLAVLVTFLHERYEVFHVNLTTTPFALIGLALSIFLGFRNNTSYDRFWEGRKLWGRMVNVSRSFARQVDTFVDASDEDTRAATRTELVLRQVAYVHAFRMHMRKERDPESLASYLDPEEVTAMQTEDNPPLVILRGTAARLRRLWKEGRIDVFHLRALDDSLTEITTVQGACERISSTPIPYVYTVLMHRIVAVYCFALPFGLITTAGLATPFVVLMISYAFYGIDAVGEEIEDPFGVDANDLPLHAISTMIEINLREHLGREDAPARRSPEKHILC